MQRCTNELYWMDQQAEERINYDWSNTNPDYPTRQRQYEVGSLKDGNGDRCSPVYSVYLSHLHRTSSVNVWSPKRPPSLNWMMMERSWLLLSILGRMSLRYRIMNELHWAVSRWGVGGWGEKGSPCSLAADLAGHCVFFHTRPSHSVHCCFSGSHGGRPCWLERVPEPAHLWGEPPQTHGWVPQG